MQTTELARLVSLAEQAASGQPDLVASLAATIHGVVARDADPYLVMGSLIEGLTHTLTTIPLGKQRDTAKAAVALLVGRLRAEGLL